MKLVAQVHIAELYHQKKDNKNFAKTVMDLENELPKLLNA